MYFTCKGTQIEKINSRAIVNVSIKKYYYNSLYKRFRKKFGNPKPFYNLVGC